MKIRELTIKVLRYGGTAGSDALLAAVSKFINKQFHPSQPTHPSQIMATNGVTAILDMLPFAVCDPGEGIMYTTPGYGMFKHDIESRNSIKIVEVPCADGFDQFSAQNADVLIDMFESALRQASKKGIVVKAILICNPCNPLGRCYSRSSLIQLAKFCSRNNLHLISDEIYAMSVFSSPDENSSHRPALDGFTSVLAIDQEADVDGRNMHILYGASKDFGLGGLRLGFLITRNDVLKEACRRLAYVVCSSFALIINWQKDVHLDYDFLRHSIHPTSE